MKLRFDHNSLRLRLKKPDLEKLRRTLFVEEIIAFPDKELSYRLQIHADNENVLATLAGSAIEVSIPKQMAFHWMNSDETGIYQTIHLKDNNNLQITIEKDFPCKDTPEADAGDFFSPPQSANAPDQC